MSNILIVEDSGFIRLQLRSLLEQQGYTVYEAINGNQAMTESFHKEVKLKDIDIVLLDFHLPDYNADEVLPKILEKTPYLPVLILSVEQKKETIIRIIDSGAKDYLVKPFDSEKLLQRIQRYLPGETSDKKIEPVTSDFDKMKDTLFEEVDRSIRSNSNLTVMMITGEEEKIGEFFKTASEQLRKIDSIYQLEKDRLILILPITDEQGSNIVINKIANTLEEITEEDLNIKKALFPDQVSQEFIDQYRVEELVEEILNAVNPA